MKQLGVPEKRPATETGIRARLQSDRQGSRNAAAFVAADFPDARKAKADSREFRE
jgi:hypothetical protein